MLEWDMVKKFFVLLILLIISTPVFGETLKGGVSYTEEEVRAMAFSGVKKKLPRKLIKENQIDPNFDENKAKLEEGRKQTELDDRIIYVSDSGWYSVSYKKNMKYRFYYNSVGSFEGFSIALDDEAKYPCRYVLYDENGEILSLVCFVRPKVLYEFDKNKKLICITKY